MGEVETLAEEEIICEAGSPDDPVSSVTPRVSESEKDVFERIPDGSVVEICGLQSEQGKKMNGQRAYVLTYIPDVHRYLLKIEGETKKKRVKVLNVKPTGFISSLDYEDIVDAAKLLNRSCTRVVRKRVDIRQFKCGSQIGGGPNSRIKVAVKLSNYDMGEDPSIEKVALKLVSHKLLWNSPQSDVLKRSLLNERETMYKCRDLHPYILDLYATARSCDDIYFVLEYAPNADLQQWALKLRGLPESCVRFYTACIVDALEAMHERMIYHRDVKPENVFLDENYLPKLGDFGCAVEHGDAIDFTGSPSYMPPEMLRHQVSQDTIRATDYWSLGAMVYFLEFGKLCFYGENDHLTMSKSRVCNYKMPYSGNEITKDLIKSLLVIDIKKRLGWKEGWQEIKRHKFFEDIDWEALRVAKGPPENFWEAKEGEAGEADMSWQ